MSTRWKFECLQLQLVIPPAIHALQAAALGQRYTVTVSDDEVIQHADIHQRQGIDQVSPRPRCDGERA